MNGKEKITAYIERFVRLSEEEKAMFADAFEEVPVVKRQFVVQPEFTARYRYYVLEGAFRSYIVCHQGQEHTISFAIEDWWISDYNSYIYQQPATQFVVALEDSRVLRITHEKEAELKETHHVFETFFRIIAERGLAHYQQRITSNLTQTAEARYKRFLSKYPEAAQRLPQYALASYLGMTTEYLSRLRNKRSRSKSI